MNRRDFLFALASLGLGGTSYVRFLEPTWLEVSQRSAKLQQYDLPASIRLLHLSDLHASKVVPLVRLRQQQVLMIGLGDLWTQECLAAEVFERTEKQPNLPRIVLSHNPDSKDVLAPYDWDLLLCGHTHGGQFELPIWGTPFAPVRDHRFVKGLHEWNGRLIHVTKGVGNVLGIRFNCRPEVSMLKLT